MRTGLDDRHLVKRLRRMTPPIAETKMLINWSDFAYWEGARSAPLVTPPNAVILLRDQTFGPLTLGVMP